MLRLVQPLAEDMHGFLDCLTRLGEQIMQALHGHSVPKRPGRPQACYRGLGDSEVRLASPHLGAIACMASCGVEHGPCFLTAGDWHLALHPYCARAGDSHDGIRCPGAR